MVIKIIIGFLIIVFGLIGLRKLTWPTNPYPQQQAASDTIPQFNTVDVDFVHQFNNEKSLPFMGAAIFNLEGNDEQYLFVGGGYNQEDKLFKFSSGQFIDVSAKAGLQKPANDTTYGVVAVDANRDGLPIYLSLATVAYTITKISKANLKSASWIFRLITATRPSPLPLLIYRKKAWLIYMSRLILSRSLLRGKPFLTRKIMVLKAFY